MVLEALVYSGRDDVSFVVEVSVTVNSGCSRFIPSFARASAYKVLSITT